MANSIDKYGVPLPSGRNRTMSQPKAKYKFRVVVEKFGINSDDKDHMTMEVDEVSRPKVTFNTQTAWMFGRSTSYIGSESWEPITLTIRDAVGNGSAKAIARQIQKQRDFQRRLCDKSVQKFSSYKFAMIIETLTGENREDSVNDIGRGTLEDIATAITNNAALTNSISKVISGGNRSVSDYFYCTGCMIMDIDYDTLNYSSSQYVTIKLTIKPDNVIQFDQLDKMYADQISSLLGEDVDNALNIIDNIFKI